MPEDEWRSYRLLKLGVSLSEQQSMSAVRMDWLLAIDESLNEAGANG